MTGSREKEEEEPKQEGEAAFIAPDDLSTIGISVFWVWVGWWCVVIDWGVFWGGEKAEEGAWFPCWFSASGS